MEAAKFPTKIADIVVLDKEEKLVLFVEVKSHTITNITQQKQVISQIKFYLQHIHHTNRFVLADNPFIMLATTENITIFIWDGNDFSDPIVSLNTENILCNYDEEFSELRNNNRISGFYLETLVEAWLRDLAYHWKSEQPPEFARLQEIGFSQKIEGGITYSQVNLNGDTLR
ncbi:MULTISPECIES: type I restriction enzyme HsdR N-terminal domain-containing protein [unclassified Anabaena]|uniref:type I restriction enzyme HsdR N-terminal domain-containing protein n=1 Tax=unclassified Anabaena TaxID=2619674 RepID=UPI00082BED3B|nr:MULTISPECIES: type I restriction enzyme HsdR N-terminal domain-containing protein [unclassified Anabaena]